MSCIAQSSTQCVATYHFQTATINLWEVGDGECPTVEIFLSYTCCQNRNMETLSFRIQFCCRYVEMWECVQVERLTGELAQVAADRDQLRAAMEELPSNASATRARLDAALFQNEQLQVSTSGLSPP